jgi:hypothetical protein
MAGRLRPAVSQCKTGARLYSYFETVTMLVAAEVAVPT